MTVAAVPDPDDRFATLVRWLRPDGSYVAADETICELATDKAEVEVPACTAGILRHLARPGDRVDPGDEVARIDPLP